jgi:hypothetical protein
VFSKPKRNSNKNLKKNKKSPKIAEKNRQNAFQERQEAKKLPQGSGRSP